MKFRVLGCSGGQIPGRNLSSYLVNDSLLIDAGSVTAVLGFKAQQKLKNVLITHIHLDHVMGLATLADNLSGNCKSTINVWGSARVISGLKFFFFNDTVWPNIKHFTANARRRLLQFCKLPEEKVVRVEDFAITMIGVNHVVPSVAFFIEHENNTLLHVGDTGPTERVWSLARCKDNLRAVVLEVSFPNRLQKVADMSGHLTPQTIAQEVGKLGRPSIPILLTHFKPQHRDEIIRDLKWVTGQRLRILEDGDTLRFGSRRRRRPPALASAPMAS